MVQAVVLLAGMGLLLASALKQKRRAVPRHHREGNGMLPFILLGLGLIEMTLKTVSGFTDPKALQVTIDVLCLFLLGWAIFLFARRRPRQSGTRGRQ